MMTACFEQVVFLKHSTYAGQRDDARGVNLVKLSSNGIFYARRNVIFSVLVPPSKWRADSLEMVLGIRFRKSDHSRLSFGFALLGAVKGHWISAEDNFI